MEKTKTNWFLDWFNSPYYHILYKNRDFKEASFFINNLLKKLNIPENSKLMDLACGRGRHAILLNQRELDVTGLDLSEENINYAKRFENSQLEFYKHDMRFPFRSNYYDYVFNLFSSFGYFESETENYKTIRFIKDALKPEGILVIDFMNINFVLQNLLKEEIKIINDIEFHLKKYIENNFLYKEITIFHNAQMLSFIERVQLLSHKNFENYFNHSGLSILHTYGDYSLNEYKKNESERLILIAKKDK